MGPLQQPRQQQPAQSQQPAAHHKPLPYQALSISVLVQAPQQQAQQAVALRLLLAVSCLAPSAAAHQPQGQVRPLLQLVQPAVRLPQASSLGLVAQLLLLGAPVPLLLVLASASALVLPARLQQHQAAQRQLQPQQLALVGSVHSLRQQHQALAPPLVHPPASLPLVLPAVVLQLRVLLLLQALLLQAQVALPLAPLPVQALQARHSRQGRNLLLAHQQLVGPMHLAAAHSTCQRSPLADRQPLQQAAPQHSVAAALVQASQLAATSALEQAAMQQQDLHLLRHQQVVGTSQHQLLLPAQHHLLVAQQRSLVARQLQQPIPLAALLHLARQAAAVELRVRRSPLEQPPAAATHHPLARQQLLRSSQHSVGLVPSSRQQAVAAL